MNIEKIILEPQNPKEPAAAKKLRVAAYCRVSTDNEEQRTSFENQVKAYTDMIESRPDWKLAGIYADEGMTGTSVSKRKQFLKMIRDCEAGRIDLIVTKSISRFARNTLECLTFVRHLNKIGVHLIFESNNIDTRTAFSEMLLTVLAAFARKGNGCKCRNIKENELIAVISEKIGEELTEDNAALLKKVLIEMEDISVEYADNVV